MVQGRVCKGGSRSGDGVMPTGTVWRGGCLPLYISGVVGRECSDCGGTSGCDTRYPLEVYS